MKHLDDADVARWLQASSWASVGDVARRLLAYCRKPAGGEDAASVAVERVWRHRGSFRGEPTVARFLGWVRGIAQNESRRRHGVEARRVDRAHLSPAMESVVPAPGLTPEQEALNRARDAVLRAFIDGPPNVLSSEEQAVLRRELALGEAPREIGAALGMPAAKVARLAHGARQRLKEELVRLGWATPGEKVVLDRLLPGWRAEGCYRGRLMIRNGVISAVSPFGDSDEANPPPAWAGRALVAEHRGDAFEDALVADLMKWRSRK